MVDATDGLQVPLVTPPSPGLHPMISLATSLQASPGVYALLLGSGVSTAAGVPTGWQIVSDLVRRAAAAKFPEDPEAADTALVDPEVWWLEHGDGEPLGYSGLLQALAPTPAARHALLTSYFEPTEEEQREGLKAPGAAHKAIAQLIAKSAIRVVLTTNFDRLLERALEALGVQPQVLHRPEQIAAATPLRHHRATIIKLHGDYADLDKRNTVDELESYPEDLGNCLRTVLDEYGLLVSGWSGDWDVALVAALEETRSRRYPLFWSYYGSSLGESAQRLVAQQGAVQLSGQTADDLFGGVLARVEALDRLADPPVSRAMAVVRLKRALPDPVRRIELYDLIDREVAAVVSRAQDQERYPLVIQPLTPEAFEQRVAGLRGDTDTLLHLLVTGVFHDVDGSHDSLWVRVVQRLLTGRNNATGAQQQVLEQLRHYPALLAASAIGTAAVVAGRDEVVGTVLRSALWKANTGMMLELNAATALNPYQVLDSGFINQMPRWSLTNSTFYYPQSHLLRADLQEALSTVEADQGRYKAAFDRFELLASLIALATPIKYKHIWPGEVAMGERWGYDAEGEREHPILAQLLADTDTDWPFITAAGFTSKDEAKELIVKLAGDMENMRNNRW